MAGVARPTALYARKEASVNLIGGVLNPGSSPNGLFDGTQVNEWNTNRVAYWNTSTHYVEFEITTTCNIWRSGTSNWPGYTAKLEIRKWDGSSFVPIVDTYSMPTSAITEKQWEMFVKELPPGRYRFYCTGYRLDSEWYVEESFGDLVSNIKIIDLTTIGSANVGDILPCTYVVDTVGSVGVFTNIGDDSNIPLIPISHNTSSGKFYFIYVGNDHKGRYKFIADRVVQYDIAWATLNAAGFVYGNELQSQLYYPKLTYLSSSPAGLGNSSYLFDRLTGGSAAYWGNGTTAPWIIDFKSDYPTDAKKLGIYSYTVSGVEPVKDFELYGGLNPDLSDLQLIATGTHQDVAAWQDYDITNGVYQYFRLKILSIYPGNGGNNAGISEIRIQSQTIIPDGCKLIVRMPTGGITSTDRNNEWDKCVVESTLGGNITAGYIGVWNWGSIYTLTSSTIISDVSRRVIRGYSLTGSSYFSIYDVEGYVGFRPVLVAEIPINPELEVITKTIQAEKNTDIPFSFSIIAPAVAPPTGASYRYRITAESPSVSAVVSDWVAYDWRSSISETVTVPASLLQDISPLTVTVWLEEIIDGVVTTYSDSGVITLIDTAPLISPTDGVNYVRGLTVDATIGDPDTGDLVQYRVILNGVQVYPETGFTEFLPAGQIFTRTFYSGEVLIGEPNTVVIEAYDNWGAFSTVTTQFVGVYAGLMFSDEAGDYYSTDLGEILKYLEIGTIIAGQTSPEYKVLLKNTNGYSVNNIRLFATHNLGSDVTIELSRGNQPFIAENPLVFTQTLAYNEEIPFFVRVVTTRSAGTGGIFNIAVKADPL